MPDGAGTRFSLTKLEPMLQNVYKCLALVMIGCMGYAELITTYDSRSYSLFYRDPPNWEGFDHIRLEAKN